MPAILRIGRMPNNTLFGTAEDDIFQAGDGRDVFYGNGGQDIFIAGGGDDTIFGAAGDDTVDAGAGDDTIHADGGADSIMAGAGADTIHAGEGADSIAADAGSDTVYAGGGNDTLRGGDGRDVLRGEGGDDLIIGGPDDGFFRLARAPSGLDAALGVASVADQVLDVRAILAAPGPVAVALDGVAHDVLVGAMTILIGGREWSSFCVQLPEPIYWGPNAGYTATSGDAALALSAHWQQGGQVAPGLADITRDTGLERARLLLAQEIFDALGGDGAGVTGFVKPGQQDQLAVAGPLAITAEQSTAAQLLLWDIAYDFDGHDLGSINLSTGAFRATDTAAIHAAFDALLAGLSLGEPRGAAIEPGHPLAVTVGDNVFGNDGADVFRFSPGDGVDMIWDFQAGQDLLEITGFGLDQLSAGFVTVVDDPAIAVGDHRKLALILGEAGEGVVFNDLGERTSAAPAVRIGDAVLSVAQLWAMASAAPVASPPPATAADVAASLHVTNSWWGGFQAEITVTAAHAVSDWDVSLSSAWSIQALWGATRLGEAGHVLSLHDAGWNAVLAPGQTATIGFTAATGVQGEMALADILAGLSVW